ncbi:hypothetical protein [Streptomyces radicis]|uniref:Uncharacterized protein n=1 Tax=Streptomyces radicis TaxID=1750517 RepID=A0A3A9W712_9ACTN|nr:hypothetical protein [Streptomyces radicis]RKN05074.1 hypothetical protein D7319_26265 [Streptomyces radicis]RKN16400.1 hypothetical protein D7318_25630 [Streptomyces radicis]
MARGSLTFEELLHLSLGQLDEAVGEWDLQVQRLDEMKENAEAMVRRTRRANWRGENADVTTEFVTEQGEQFEAARRQAATLRELVRDGHQRLKTSKDRLTTLVETDAPALGVHISASGEVTSDLTGLDPETRRTRQDAVIEVSERITDVLRTVAEDDAEISRALRMAMGTDPDRFTPVDYTSVQQATLAHEDARRALELMERGGELSADELNDLALLLELHQDDPAFAEHIATELGPRGVLEYWSDLSTYAPGGDGGEEWTDSAGALQTSLGAVLGTATRSDSAAMERWERDLIDLADEPIGDGAYPLGFHATSALMHGGTWEDSFLLDYGDALFAHERDSGAAPASLWDMNSGPTVSFVGDDPGRDPMVGFLSGLSHAPAAATEFFAPPEGFDPTADDVEINERLQYLAVDRDWWTDHGEDRAAPAQLGAALLAATTGSSAAGFSVGDLEDMESALQLDMRSVESAAVMEQVVHLYGTADPDLIHEQPEMAESLGLMASMYMDDIGYWVTTNSDEQRNDVADVYETSYGGHLRNGHFPTIDFLIALGESKTAHAVTNQGVFAYTVGSMSTFPPDDTTNFLTGHELLHTGAEMRGILDEARILRVEEEFATDQAAQQQELAQSAGWMKAATGGLLGVAAGGAAVLLTGGAAPVVVPIVAGGASPLAAEFINQNIDALVSQGDSEGAMDRAGFRRTALEEIATMQDQYWTDLGPGVDTNTSQLSADLLSRAYDGGRNMVEKPDSRGE